jgi:catechol 2,3-dioxygenase-like lactoylglutathione lyase family enzyme
MSNTSSLPQQKIAFGGVTPVLRVASIEASIDYYTRALGFRVNFLYPDSQAPDFASISRGHCSVFAPAIREIPQPGMDRRKRR